MSVSLLTTVSKYLDFSTFCLKSIFDTLLLTLFNSRDFIISSGRIRISARKDSENGVVSNSSALSEHFSRGG